MALCPDHGTQAIRTKIMFRFSPFVDAISRLRFAAKANLRSFQEDERKKINCVDEQWANEHTLYGSWEQRGENCNANIPLRANRVRLKKMRRAVKLN